MKGDHIYYKKGYKYQLARSYALQMADIKGFNIKADWIELTQDGVLIISAGYAWDGASGPTIDTPSSMRGSLVHDVLYQLMRLGLLPESYRERADILLHDICEEDGMCSLRADLWEDMVELFASGCAKAGSEQKIIEAP
jgi:hypothetical protein